VQRSRCRGRRAGGTPDNVGGIDRWGETVEKKIVLPTQTIDPGDAAQILKETACCSVLS
jgi:hypothetical protein